MNSRTFKEIRLQMGYTQAGFAKLLGLKEGRSVRYYESGKSTIPAPICLLVELLSGRKKIDDCVIGK